MSAVQTRPKTKTSEAKTALSPAASRIATALSSLLTPRELEELAERLGEQTPPKENSPRQRLADAVTGGAKRYSPAERARMETAARLRYFDLRRELLEGALTTAQAAALLGVSRQTPHDRVKAGTLFAIRDKGGLRFPPWQFDADGPNGVVAGLPEIRKTLSFLSPLSQASWLSRPHRLLEEGESPIAALRQGKRDAIYRLAQAVGAV